ncbi:MAG TPA: circularly permuted type 2 ATP-grasp protein, partial [Opitutales bacterium]|nr:circularly permuted type 2 ATP-grasp protein [Opitutales bacterium]
WLPVSRKLSELGIDGFRRRTEMVKRIVQENGITYNAYGDSISSRRPWVMDPLPMIVSHAEWSAIERGVSQRVRLLNSILADIYGPQKLVRSGQLPPSLIHGNPHFLRPCHGFQPPGGVFVHIYAADLARSRDGSWRIIADRVDVPSGIGYAVENRFITQQVMPDIFREAEPVRLKPFFQRMLESFETLVQRRTEEPCIVMLSPGPSFETYFEQAFFARNLGYPLVEGADLTTRDNRVFMKTVGGLRQVDVIIRNVPGTESDPLELDSASRLGVPGLVEAARMGNVVIANSLGAGVTETPAMPAFLGGLCRHMFGEDILIPSAETLWCGNPQSLARVMADLPKYVVKPVFRSRSGEAIFGPLLSNGELDRLRRMIAAEPSMYAAQDLVNDSTIPALSADGVAEPRHSVMRVFLVAGKDGYEMMPGALTRVTEDCESFSVSMADGGASKDTWMIAPTDAPQKDHALPHTGPVKIRRSTAELTSREADNLFWMGRYMERTDYQTRLLRVLASETRECSGSIVPEHIVPFINTALGLPPDGP